MNNVNLILIIFLLYSCGSRSKDNDKDKSGIDSLKQDSRSTNIWEKTENKTIWFKSDSKLYHSIDSLPKEFIEFYEKFISDSNFQKEHINFPIIAVIAECDSTIDLTNKNWENYTWDFRKDFNNPIDSNLIYLNNDRFYFECNRNEIGLLFQIGFEKINGKWFLTLYIVNTC
ncbi:MAG: DUF4348 domain-containing protein [Bacteroidota bacterium]